MKISLIIPAFNEEKLLAATLTAVRAALPVFSERGWSAEIIVCDNNSTDRTAEIAQAAGAKVVFEPMNQIARARNAGATGADGDWVVFLDADSHPSRDLLGALADKIAAGNTILAGARMQPDESTATSWFVYKIWNGMSRWRRWATGPFIACDAAAFRELGGFDERLYGSEDIDFSLRMRKLARRQDKKIVILTPPLLTSARKMKLYRRREYVRFLLKTLFTGGRTFLSKADCYTWYDGRR